jgi:hypothetical protein
MLNYYIVLLDDEHMRRLSHAWQLYDRLENKTYRFSHRTSLDKIQMMDALDYERAIIDDHPANLSFYRQLARSKARHFQMEPILINMPSRK